MIIKYRYNICNYFNIKFNSKDFEINLDIDTLTEPIKIVTFLNDCPITFNELTSLCEFLIREMDIDEVSIGFNLTKAFIDDNIKFTKILKWLDYHNIHSDSDFLDEIGLLVFDVNKNTQKGE